MGWIAFCVGVPLCVFLLLMAFYLAEPIAEWVERKLNG